MAIGFYSRRKSLPHKPYPMATLRKIERAIVEAWRIIRDEPEGGFRLDHAKEDAITRELRSCLLDRVLAEEIVTGFSYKHFRVNRESKFESYNGDHLDKMPDLHIDVVRDNPPSYPSADGLFAECKPVDLGHPAGSAYCDLGIIRFVVGQYAWAMTQALMVGYAASGYTLPRKLQEALAKRKAVLKTKGVLAACPDCTAEGYAQHPHITVHQRGYTYSTTKRKAGPITIRHLWLNRN